MKHENNIDNYFDRVKQNPPLIEIEKVHQIITSPTAVARLKGNNRNLLKFTIMTTIFAVIISAVLFWPGDDTKESSTKYQVSSITTQEARQVSGSDEYADNVAQLKNELKTEQQTLTNNAFLTTDVQYYQGNIVSGENNRSESDIKSITESNHRVNSFTEKFVSKKQNEDGKLIDFQAHRFISINESGKDLSKFEIDIAESTAPDFNQKKKMVWLSLKSINTKNLSMGEYQYSSLNPNNRPPMSFSGGYFLNADSMLKIIGGRFILDTFPSDYAMQYELILENHQKITGKYQPKPYQKEEQNHSIEKQKQEFVYPDQILDSTLFIELNQQEFKELGFTFENQTVKLKFLVNEGNWFLNLIDSSAIFGFEFSDKPTHKTKEDKNNYVHMEANNFEMKTKNYDDATDYQYGITPMLVTNENGRRIRRIFKLSMPEENLKNMFSKQFEKDFKTLLPVIMKRNTFGHQPKENFVFWFLPTDEFFNHLPKGISKELLKEYNYITADDKSAFVQPECKYFDECKNTLKVSSFKVYPNPASTSATVSFTLPDIINGRITLVDLAGRERLVLLPQSSYAKGSHQIDVDVSSVPEGIYLITLYSDKGIQTQRFIVTR